MKSGALDERPIDPSRGNYQPWKSGAQHFGRVPYRTIPAATATVEERRFSAALGGFDMGFSPGGRCLPSKDDHQG